MKDTIENIIELDKRTQNLVEETDKKLEMAKEQLRSELFDMELKATEDAQRDAETAVRKILEEAETEERRIEQENQTGIDKLDRTYNERKDQLLNEVFNRFIMDKND